MTTGAAVTARIGLKELRSEARELGATTDQLGAVTESDDPRATITEILHGLRQAAGAAAGAAAAPSLTAAAVAAAPNAGGGGGGNKGRVLPGTASIMETDTIPGGYHRGDKVVSTVDHQAAKGTIKKGDVGTVLGAGSGKWDGRVLCQFANFSANIAMTLATIEKEGGAIPGGYHRGDKVVSTVDHQAAEGTIKKGDVGTVLGAGGGGCGGFGGQQPVSGKFNQQAGGGGFGGGGTFGGAQQSAGRFAPAAGFGAKPVGFGGAAAGGGFGGGGMQQAGATSGMQQAGGWAAAVGASRLSRLSWHSVTLSPNVVASSSSARVSLVSIARRTLAGGHAGGHPVEDTPKHSRMFSH